jgi:hypothetical protein
MATDRSVVMIVAQVLIVQQDVHTEIATHVRLRAHIQIAANAVTVHAIRAHQVIVQQVARTEIAIHVQVHARPRIAANVQHAVMVIDQIVAMALLQDHLLIAANVVMVHAIHDPRQINPAEATHTVAIVHALAMIVTHDHLRVTANAVADQIAPAVGSPMIAKNVHAVALAKSV